jgi:segregation and condensation protein B
VTRDQERELGRSLEALLFLAPDPVAEAELADALECSEEELAGALAWLQEEFAPGARGLLLRRLAGGWTFATAPEAEPAARRLLGRPRTPPLTPAQAETLAIVAYLQPVSRPEVTRIRGVSADSAAATLLERGLVEEAGRSTFGAVLYRTTPLFLKLFGLGSLQALPDPAAWDPTPDEEADLRERLLGAGEARAAV